MPTGKTSTRSVATIAVLTALLFLAGCDGGRERDSADRQAPIDKLESRQESFERRASGCAAGQDCATVSVRREVFERRPALNKTVLRQLIRQLQGNGEDQTSATSLEEVADNFLAEAAQVEGVGSAPWQLTGEARHLSRHDNLLTIEINSYLYTGGAHGMPSVHWLNWDLATDERVSLGQVIRNGKRKQFWKEAKAAHQRWLDEQPGANREFRQMWPFRRSEDFRLGDEGLVLQYDVYVLGPYVLGPVQLTIPWEDLRGLVREQYLPANAPTLQ